MTERKRLIELIRKGIDERSVSSVHEPFDRYFADYLLSTGVIVPPIPVKVGDAVYRIMCRDIKDFFIREETVWIIDRHAVAGIEIITKYLDNGRCAYFPKIEEDSIGKTIFFSREEAERELERREK